MRIAQALLLLACVLAPQAAAAARDERVHRDQPLTMKCVISDGLAYAMISPLELTVAPISGGPAVRSTLAFAPWPNDAMPLHFWWDVESYDQKLWMTT